MENTNHHAGSATGFDLAALTRYDFFETDDDDELRVEPTGRWVRFEEVEALARATPRHPEALAAAVRAAERIDAMHKGVVGVFAAIKAEHEAATPQHSVTEQASIDTPEFRSLMDEFEKSVGRSTLERDDAEFAIIRHIDARAKPLASTAATQPEQASDLTSAVDAAMVEMANIYPPLRRSDCARLIRAALAILVSTAPTAPVRLSEEHPNLKVPIDPACSAKLDELGDDRGQGLDPYWKFGFRTGWHHGVRSLMASTAASEQQASVSEQARKRIAARFANRPRTPATADFDLPAPNDEIEVSGAHHLTPESIAATIKDLREIEDGTTERPVIDRDWRTWAGVLARVIEHLSGRATIPSEAGDSVLAPIINAVEMHDATCLNSTIPDETLIWTATSVMGEQLHVTLGDFRRIAAMAAPATSGGSNG